MSAFALVAALALFAALLVPQLVYSGSADSRAQIRQAWNNARAAGGYTFRAQIVQTTIPLAIPANIGRSSKQQTLQIEGSTDFSNQMLELALWPEGANTLDRSSATQIKVENNTSYSRRGDQAWQEIPDFAGAFAPDGDFLAYLSAAKEIVNQGSDTRAGIAFTRYSFAINGPRFAAFVRNELEQRKARQGELAPGQRLDLPAQYRDMTGEGELWVRDDGLPLRQIIRASFPDQGDHRVEATFSVDFSGYLNAAQVAGGPAGLFGVAQLRAALGALAPSPLLASQALIIMLMIGLAYLTIRHARSRRLYTALSMYMVISMIITPLLQPQQAYAAGSDQREQAQLLQQQQQQAAAQQAADQMRAASEAFDPHLSPLAAAAQDDAVTRVVAGQLPATSAASPAQQAAPCADTSDSDGDGLTGCQEKLLGTDPNKADSDRDELSDGQEVAGFSFGGKTWYTDPNQISTLKDNVLDGLKCPLNTGTGQHDCAVDTDGDGTPDALDRDSDGDGVPNQIDLSPLRTSPATFGKDNPVSLVVNGLQPNKPTSVEFQIRPTTDAHLYQALNVLDWADGDHQGQIQRDDDYKDANGERIKTFFDACANGTGSATPCALSPDANGDIRLVPMLEIRVPAASTILPSQAELNALGGIVVQKPDSTGTRVVYVSLQMVNEPNTDARVAFYGKMLYRPGSTWGGAQQVRLVWLVSMLVDVCQEAKGAICTSYKDANGVDYHNQIQTVHTYYDDFKLTALNVREDSGSDVALAYEDPAVDSDLNDDFALTALAGGLDAVFLTGRDCDSLINGVCVSNGRTDITVSGRGVGAPRIVDRFDRLQNSGVSDILRWQIPNILRVESRSYEHRDQAIATLAITDTKSILDTNFTPRWSASAPITPTILYAREDRFRAANLSQQGTGTGVQRSGSQLTVDFNADSGTPVMTSASLSWAPFAYDGVSWQSVGMADYWKELDRRMVAAREPGDSQRIADGKVAVAQIYYTLMNGGLSNVVQIGSAPTKPDVDFVSDTEHAGVVSGAATYGPRAAKIIATRLAFRERLHRPGRDGRLHRNRTQHDRPRRGREPLRHGGQADEHAPDAARRADAGVRYKSAADRHNRQHR